MKPQQNCVSFQTMIYMPPRLYIKKHVKYGDIVNATMSHLSSSSCQRNLTKATTVWPLSMERSRLPISTLLFLRNNSNNNFHAQAVFTIESFLNVLQSVKAMFRR
jgi:hypothetical protein